MIRAEGDWEADRLREMLKEIQRLTYATSALEHQANMEKIRKLCDRELREHSLFGRAR